MEIKTVAVVGAGVMGCGTALDLACYGYDVVMKDIDAGVLAAAKKRIEDEFRFVKMMKKEVQQVTLDQIWSHITLQNDYERFDAADLVIENIVEELDAKEKEYARLVGVCKKDALFAINTSCISITKIASLLPDPSRAIGTHFMNPVPLKKMVEVIKGFHTSPETEAAMTAFLKTLGKTAVVINDYPGFVSNRVSHLFMNEAAFLVQDNVATAAQIDMIFKQGYGHKMGPLETADLIGLDTVVRSLDILYASYQDSKFRCCPLLKKMVDGGLLGKKSGKGFYNY